MSEEDTRSAGGGSAGSLRAREATEADLQQLLPMLRAFYAEDRIPLDERRVQSGLQSLVADAASGALLILEDGRGSTIGYVALGWCFSIEQGGRFLLLDELYLVPEARGRGRGRAALELVRGWARRAGACAVRLEVNRHNPRAKRIYLSAGYREDDRDILTLLLTEVE